LASGSPVTLAWLPNALTVARLVLVGPTVGCILSGWTGLALTLLLAAALTDVLDGWLARSLRSETPLGALLDPLADKALLSGAFVALGWTGALPPWLVVLVAGRDLAILAGALAFRIGGRSFVPEPSRLSRLNTLAQVALVAVVLALDALAEGGVVPGPAAGAWVVSALIGAVVLTTVGSGLTYAERGWRRWHERTPPAEGAQ